jgi:hypothetical protein
LCGGNILLWLVRHIEKSAITRPFLLKGSFDRRPANQK